MKILSYFQAREELGEGLSEEQVRMVLTVSGRAREWIKKCSDMVAQCHSDTELVEESGMGREVLKSVPQIEWVYLVNPSLAPKESKIVAEHVVVGGQIFSSAFFAWLGKQEIGEIYRLSEVDFTPDEAKVMKRLWEKQEGIVEREEVATVLWNEEWSNKYSDWALDALISRLRKKLNGKWQIVTIKGRGYMLVRGVKPTMALKRILGKERSPVEIPGSIYPSNEYLEYMNDEKRVRKVYTDLFKSLDHLTNQPLNHLPIQNILCVNSYSYDNVDAIVKWVGEQKLSGVQVTFTHYDPSAIELHQTRIGELGVSDWVTCLYDDMRESKVINESMDLVINDFRLNFNQNDAQNRAMTKHTYRVLRPGGVALISTVVDGKYENVRYGIDQEKAPINAKSPGTFQADEHLVRRCWSVPYYRDLWKKTGFSEIVEFDVEEGKRWGAGSVTLTTDPWSGPYYRRWRLGK